VITSPNGIGKDKSKTFHAKKRRNIKVILFRGEMFSLVFYLKKMHILTLRIRGISVKINNDLMQKAIFILSLLPICKIIPEEDRT